MYESEIVANKYLQENIRFFYHTDYVGYQNTGNPDYINTFKNTYGSYSNIKLNSSVRELENVLSEDLPQIFQLLQLNSLTVLCSSKSKSRNQLSTRSIVI